MITKPQSIESIPDFPAAQQLARALWGEHPTRRRAAVLVGAGFSANAELSAGDTPRPPFLWSDFARGMKGQLPPRARARAVRPVETG